MPIRTDEILNYASLNFYDLSSIRKVAMAGAALRSKKSVWILGSPKGPLAPHCASEPPEVLRCSIASPCCPGVHWNVADNHDRDVNCPKTEGELVVSGSSDLRFNSGVRYKIGISSPGITIISGDVGKIDEE